MKTLQYQNTPRRVMTIKTRKKGTISVIKFTLGKGNLQEKLKKQQTELGNSDRN